MRSTWYFLSVLDLPLALLRLRLASCVGGGSWLGVSAAAPLEMEDPLPVADNCIPALTHLPRSL